MLVTHSRHVFSDIRAYVCTSPECGMLMFDSFTTWRRHEMDHRREWICPVCDLQLHDKLKARMHLMHHHAELAEQQEIEMLLQTSSRPSEHLSAANCPFCDWGATLREQNRTPKEHDLMVPSRRFMKHLGRHLEEIALFVIPQPDEDQESSGETASNAAQAVHAEDSVTISTVSSFKSQPPSGIVGPRRSIGKIEAKKPGPDMHTPCILIPPGHVPLDPTLTRHLVKRDPNAALDRKTERVDRRDDPRRRPPRSASPGERRGASGS